jgi:DNA polymerase-3 subunit alpha
VLVFPEAWGLLSDRVKTDVPVLLKGGYSRRDQGVENPTFIVESVTPFVELRLTGQVAVAIDLGTGHGLTPEVMRDVREVIDAHGAVSVHGSAAAGAGTGVGTTNGGGAPPLEVRWSDGNGTRTRLRSRTLRLAATQAALNELRALLGTERVRLVRGS